MFYQNLQQKVDTNPNLKQEVFGGGVGGTIAGVGAGFNLPEFKISEAFASGPGPGQVLPASTGDNAPTTGGDSASISGRGATDASSTVLGGNNQGVGSYPADKYIGWDPTAAQADWEAKGGGADGGGGGIEEYLNAIFNPGMTALQGFEDVLRTGQTDDISNLESDLARGVERVGTEGEGLLSSLGEQRRQVGETTRSAYADATRTFNNLIQQGLSRFGAGSSAGPAVQELVNQEFLRSRGKMGQQEVTSQTQLALEETKINQYITQKKEDLEEWKADAVRTVKQNFDRALADINAQRGQLESDKASSRLAALQDVRANAQAITDADRQYRVQLVQIAVDQMQEVSGRAFTPAEIAEVHNQMFGQQLAGFGQSTAPSSLNLNPSVLGRRDDTEEDRILG